MKKVISLVLSGLLLLVLVACQAASSEMPETASDVSSEADSVSVVENGLESSSIVESSSLEPQPERELGAELISETETEKLYIITSLVGHISAPGELTTGIETFEYLITIPATYTIEYLIIRSPAVDKYAEMSACIELRENESYGDYFAEPEYDYLTLHETGHYQTNGRDVYYGVYESVMGGRFFSTEYIVDMGDSVGVRIGFHAETLEGTDGSDARSIVATIEPYIA